MGYSHDEWTPLIIHKKMAGNLDAYHIRTNFIAKSNYHVVLKDSQNNISEALEQNYLAQKI